MVNFFAKSVLIAVLVGMVHAFDAWTSELAVVLRGDGSVSGVNNEVRKYHGGYCNITFPANGALRAGTYASKDSHVDFEPNPKSTCTPPVRYKLQTDGNFVISCSNNAVDYSTQSSQGGTGKYFMAIDNFCELHTFKGTFTCDAFDVEKEVWSSHKFGSWGIDGRLYKGQVYEGLPPYDIVMSPQGKLEVRYPYSNGSYKVVWITDKTPDAKFNDFYSRLTSGGRLILVGIDYPSMAQTEIYSKTLAGKAPCYTLGYKKLGSNADSSIDLIAVKCP